MSNVAHDTIPSNVAAEGDAASTPVVNTALPDATDAERKALEDYQASEAKVVELAIQTLDPKDMLRKYARLGKEALSLAAKRKASFKAWAREDLDKVCDQLETLIKMRVAIKEVRVNVYIRVHLWVEAVKAICPNVEKLSYFQVANKFLPTLSFDAVELTGEIKKEWLMWVRTTVERQLGDEPLSIKELDESIKARKAEIERERSAKKDPEKALEQEQKAAAAKEKAARRQAHDKIVDSIDKAVTEGHASTTDVVQIVSEVLKANNLSLPAKMVGFDPANCTVADCKTLAAAMAGAGKLVEMKVLRDTLDAMIKIAENAMITSKSA